MGFSFCVSSRYVIVINQGSQTFAKKVQFMSISCKLGSMSKYSRFSLAMSSLSLSQSADL